MRGAVNLSEGIEGMQDIRDKNFLGWDSEGVESGVKVMYVEGVEDVVCCAHYLVDGRIVVVFAEVERACVFVSRSMG